VLVSSNMEEVASIVDRIYVVEDGRTAMKGTPREVFAQPDVLRGYGLGVPPVSELAHALMEGGVPMPRTPLTVSEAVEDVWRILSS
jgi:energy-coupling factor transport system ATP-binding protein